MKYICVADKEDAVKDAVADVAVADAVKTVVAAETADAERADKVIHR